MGVSLGILAGMGPRSTAPFIDMLVTDCQVVCGAKYDMDFPEMHIISLPTPFWPGKKINCSEMIAALQHGIAELVKEDVSLIAVPCNHFSISLTVRLKPCQQKQVKSQYMPPGQRMKPVFISNGYEMQAER